MMACLQKVAFSSVFLAALVLSLVPASFVPLTRDQKSEAPASPLLLPSLARLTRYDTYIGALTKLAAANVQPQQVQAQLNKCNPPCNNGFCCLQPSPDMQASCQRVKLSGQSCVSGSGYTSTNPSKTEGLQQPMCPCMLGMMCWPAKPYGSCSSFKK